MMEVMVLERLIRLFFLASLAAVGLVACQTQPTKVTETPIISFDKLSQQMAAPMKITKDMVVVDVRSFFDYTMAHIPNSINLSWEEFSQVEGAAPGLLKKDLALLTRHLALKGIGPESRVLVVGKGLHGQGEEGRMAWTLFYLGVPQVQIAGIENFYKMLTNVKSTPLKNVKPWQPKTADVVLTSRNELLNAAMNPPKTVTQKIHILDVRSKKEYFHRKGKEFGKSYQTPNMKMMHIQWKEFFSANGQVQFNLKNKLLGVGVGINDRILVISNKGIRSGAVTIALLAMGFKRAANYTGGYIQLLKGR